MQRDCPSSHLLAQSQEEETAMADNPKITVDALRKRLDAGEPFLFLDTRNPQAWGESDVKVHGAIRVPVDHFEDYLPELPKDRPIVTYCT
jgi:rhodanese-related sulfurtransferase